MLAVLFKISKNLFLKGLVWLVILGLALALFSPTAFPQEDRFLLQEIEEKIKNYYLYPLDEEFFSLNSLEDLRVVLKDPYSFYLGEEQIRAFEEGLGRTYSGVGIYLELIDGRVTVVSVVPRSPAFRAGLKEGDILLAVDGCQVKGLPLEEVVLLIRGEEGTRVELVVWRGPNLMRFILKREKISLPSVEYFWKDEGLALVKIYNFNLGSAEEMDKLLERLEAGGARGVILDLRSNQGGYLEEALGALSLLREGVLLKARERNTGWRDIFSSEKARYEFPAVVLVDSRTASAAEIMAAALKDSGGALLAGEVTFGKGTVQTLFTLEQGGYLKLTTAEFASPRGRPVEGVGVEPHFLIEGGEDPLEVALILLQWITGGSFPLAYLLEPLVELGEREPGTPLPREVEGELYFPLRATLYLTGREIYPGDTPRSYYFYWENRRFVIELDKRVITYSDYWEKPALSDFLLLDNFTYVSASFLADVLSFPLFPSGGI